MNQCCALFQGINGILADEMGLGKTVQSIAFLCHIAEKYCKYLESELCKVQLFSLMCVSGTHGVVLKFSYMEARCFDLKCSQLTKIILSTLNLHCNNS